MTNPENICYICGVFVDRAQKHYCLSESIEFGINSVDVVRCREIAIAHLKCRHNKEWHP